MRDSCVTYTLGRALYVALTNRCNAVPLAMTRGPQFVMPASSGFAPLPEGFEPTADDVVAAVQARLSSGGDGGPSSVVFAGLGEPLLRLGVLLDAAHRLDAAHSGTLAIRVSSNGLVERERSVEVARALHAAGVRAATIAIASADEAQHRALLDPRAAAARSLADSDDEAPPAPGACAPPSCSAAATAPGLGEACAFVRALVVAGVQVECTAVAQPAVDLAAAAALAQSLGASFRERSWHGQD